MNEPTMHPDQLEEHEEKMRSEEEDRKVVEKWQRRFTASENYRRPYMDKNLRMYKLYRGYRDTANYAYNTKIMPPIGFEIIETIKPRLTAAKIKVNIFPTKEENVNSPSIAAWDDLVSYTLEAMEFDDLKVLWVDAMLKYGNGDLQLFWDGGDDGFVNAEVADNWLLYVDPGSKERFKGAGWMIKQGFKTKEEILDEEKERGEEMRLYIPDELEKVENRPIKDDPRRQRYEINTLKMGQIDNGKRNNSDRDQDSSTPDKQEKKVELWECFDLRKGTITTIMNREIVARNEDSAYKNVNEGNLFIDMPDILLGWEYYAMGHLEPVETTIHEIADGRNQAMDSIVFNLDPIRKIRKGSGLKADDLVHGPGATWELANANDVTFERPPELSRVWIEKDEMLRQEIQTSLALSEYTQGIPKSGQEPASKIDMLLMQTNIRFALVVRQMEIAFTQMVNAIIQMNKEFLGAEKGFRLIGDKADFKKFKESDKNIPVDARVTIEPKKEKTPEQREREVLDLYEIFVVNDQPDPQDQEDVQFYKQKKRQFQKMILEEFDKEEYLDVLLPKLKKIAEKVETPEVKAAQAQPAQPVQPAQPPQMSAMPPQQPMSEVPMGPDMAPIPMLEPEGNPEAQTPGPGLLQKLGALFKR